MAELWQHPDQDDNTHGWIKLTEIEQLDPGDDTGIPFVLIANRFKSSSPDCDNFIHDPLRYLIESQQETDSPIADLGIDWDWKVTTVVLNHHQTISATHLYAKAVVASEEKTVGISIVKKRPDAR